MKKKNKKVVVAMSGGIDSSVSAALLKRAGFDVVGVFMKFWSSFDKKGAQKIAKKIGIPFYVFNFEKEFKKKVIDYFLAEYRAGKTPNPCMVCNKEIKFGLLLKKALSLKADYIATGHYARLRREIPNNKFQITNYRLLKGKGKNKDQSYFLWKLNQKILKKTLFPVGDYTKTEVRKLAEKFKLPVLNIPESQEVCFIQTTTADFLKKYLKLKPGPIIEQVRYGASKVIGKHQGLWFYTIGQRKGIELPEGPFYVLDKNLKKNILIVTKNEKDLYKKELKFKNPNWFFKPRGKVSIKIRYKHKPALGIVKKNKVIFDKPQRAVTPGQSVVFYKGQELLGGGIIT